MEKPLTTIESKYIQQHLANERTYLAWVRTAIAIIGIGFLATSLHFNTGLQSILDDRIAISISVFSIIIGIATLLLSTIIYFRNRKNINTQTFHSSFKIILFMTIIIAVVFLLFLFYFIA